MIKFPHTFPFEAWVIPSSGYRPRRVLIEKPEQTGWSNTHFVSCDQGDVYEVTKLYYTEKEACDASLEAMNKKLVSFHRRTAKVEQQIMVIQQIINTPRTKP